MSQIAQAYIAAFQEGKDFQRPAVGLVAYGEPDSEALQLFGQALGASETPVREKLVALLVDLGRQADPLTPAGADVIRNQKILELLAGPGLAKPDAAREAAMSALRKLGVRQDLARFEQKLIALLRGKPTGEAFLLIAKAKPPGARAVLDQTGDAGESARIARAALGDEAMEAPFLAAVQQADSARDATALAAAIEQLGLIGTQRSLIVIGEHLRTPLTILIPGALEKSVRVNVLEALLYNFPDQPLFYPNNINNDNGYAMAEQLCANALGVVYREPRPPYLKIRGFPSH